MYIWTKYLGHIVTTEDSRFQISTFYWLNKYGVGTKGLQPKDLTDINTQKIKDQIETKDLMDKRPEQRPKDERLKDKGPKDKRYKRQKT